MLRKLFRFSLLELLWMCGVLAFFLGLNLRMSAVEDTWFQFPSSRGPRLDHTFQSNAGWPLSYYKVGKVLRRSVKNSEEVEQLKQERSDSDIKHFPEFNPDRSPPELLQLWPLGYISTLPLCINLALMVLAVFVPIGVHRLYMRAQKPAPEAPSPSVK